MITVLSGGVGAARFLRGLVDAIEPSDITAIVNTGDDTVLHGLHISPDIDTVIYTLADAIDLERGWGLSEETWVAMSALKRYATVRPTNSIAAPEWFNLGDHDLATHFYRTARLSEGATLSEVTTEIAAAWDLAVRIVPMSNDIVATRVSLAEDCDAGVAGSTIGFQEYFVKYRHSVAVSKVEFAGADIARPLAQSELRDSEMVIIAPSNPIVSIGPIRSLGGVDEILAQRRESVVAISPIVAGTALKGPADRMMVELGHQATVVGVAKMYAPICATLLIDNADAHLAQAVEAQGMRCVVTNTVMSNSGIAKRLAQITIGATR
ncbi:MAG: 2-phospho-L-lactate transferase [Ilumatobacteraceae bacterium]